MSEGFQQDELLAALARAKAGNATPDDKALLLRAAESGGLKAVATASGERAVAVGGNVQNSVILTGSLNCETEDGRAVIENLLAAPTRRQGFFSLAPAPSRNVVPRPNVSGPLADALFSPASDNERILAITVMHGMGGAGKTTTAIELASDRRVREHFPDGVLWATLGADPNPMKWLGIWLNALGEFETAYTASLEAASARLRVLLADARVLLVVDDVWAGVQANPFLVGGGRCRALITTRRGCVADELECPVFPLGVLTSEQAVALLSRRLRRILQGEEREQALNLAEAVGFHPLALHNAAVRLRAGKSCVELTNELLEEVARLEALDEDGHYRTAGEKKVEVTLRLTLDFVRKHSPSDWRGFAWLGVFPQQTVITARMVATLWQMPAAKADSLLERLSNEAILVRRRNVRLRDREWRSYTLHDLWHDMARRILTAAEPNGLGVSLLEANARFVEYHCGPLASARGGVIWESLENDGYIHERLVWHMERAGATAKIHALLKAETADGENLWFTARERLGQSAGYINDLIRVLLALRKRGDGNDAGPVVAPALGLQVRIALMLSSLNSLARQYCDELIAGLIRHSLWSPEQGLSYVRRHGFAPLSVRALVEIGRFRETHALVDDIGAPAWALIALARSIGLVPVAERKNAIDALCQLAYRKGDTAAVLRCFTETLDVVDDFTREHHLSMAYAVENSAARSSDMDDARRAFVSWLAARGEITKARLIIERMQSGRARVDAILALASYVTERDRLRLLTRARDEAVSTLEWHWECGPVLGMIVSKLVEVGFVDEARVVAEQTEDEQARPHVQYMLATSLGACGHPSEARLAIAAIEHGWVRFVALLSLARNLKGDARHEALADARIEMERFGSDEMRHSALVNFAACLVALGHVHVASELVLQLPHGRHRLDGSLLLIDGASASDLTPLLSTVLDEAGRLVVSDRSQALERLIARLVGCGRAAAARDVAARMECGPERAKAWLRIAEVVDSDHRSDLLYAAREESSQLRDNWPCGKALAELVAVLAARQEQGEARVLIEHMTNDMGRILARLFVASDSSVAEIARLLAELRHDVDALTNPFERAFVSRRLADWLLEYGSKVTARATVSGTDEEWQALFGLFSSICRVAIDDSDRSPRYPCGTDDGWFGAERTSIQAGCVEILVGVGRIRQANSVVSTMEHGAYRLRALLTLAAKAPEAEREGLIREACCEVDSISDANESCAAWSYVIGWLATHGQAERAKAMAEEEARGLDRVIAKLALVQPGSPVDCDTILPGVCSELGFIGDKNELAAAQVMVANVLLQHGRIVESYAFAQSVGDATLLFSIACSSDDVATVDLRQRAATEALDIMSASGRAGCLEIISANVGNFAQLGPPGVLTEIAEAIQDVTRWWP